MTVREKIAHLLRRFGLGVTQAELNRLEPLGLHGAIDALLDFEKTPEGFPVSPWEFVFGENDQVNLDPQRIAAWWGLRMAMTKRPVQEKLTLFWHDHFAISGSKVENGALMLGYNETLRNHCAGNFRTLLGEVTKDPAMLRWLDGDTNLKGKPNENFAREVLELFTMGIGNYTEKDIQELARAFTGWGLRQGTRPVGRGVTFKQVLMECISLDVPLVASAYSEGFHDSLPKTIMGKTDRFDTESALDFLVARPITAKYITGKLWEFYAYPNPEPKVVERLAKIFTTSKFEIKPVLRAVIEAPEFWSEKCVRKQVKSPADFIVSLIRQLEIAETLRAGLPAEAPAMMTMSTAPASKAGFKPVSPQLAGVAGLIYGQMQRQGMRLLYPPDVAGWDWGEAWVSPAMMAERMRFATALLGRGRQAVVELVRTKMRAKSLDSDEKVVAAFAEIFDAPVPKDRMPVLVEAVQKSGGAAALLNPQGAGTLVLNLARLTFGMPEFQLC